jgi:choline/glycine/proline betaine transport protein
MTDIKTYIKTHTNPPVFFVSMFLTVFLVAWGVIAPADLGYAAAATKDWISKYFGWWYMSSVFGFLVFVLILMFSRFGHIRIGKDHQRPDWSTWSWFSMMFTAGMGIGLVYYGVAEPIFPFKNMPLI